MEDLLELIEAEEQREAIEKFEGTLSDEHITKFDSTVEINEEIRPMGFSI